MTLIRPYTALKKMYHSPDGGETTPANDPMIAAEMALARSIMEILQEHYPGHFWNVKVDARQGVAEIRHATRMLSSQCYCLHLSKVQGNPNALVHYVKAYGGEILERFRIPRGVLDIAAYCESKNKTLTHHTQKMPE